MRSLLPLSLVFLPVAGQHSHAEWTGVFSLTAGETYTWSAERVDEHYADPSMKMIVYPVGTADASGVEAVEGPVDDLWHLKETNISAGSTLATVGEAGIATSLQFNMNTWVSLFFLKVQTTGNYGFFCAHNPVEFENKFHYFKDDHGRNIEPVYMDAHDHGDHDDEPPDLDASGWALAIGGTFLTTIPALLMVALVGPGIVNLGAETMSKVFPFASGALAGAACFLILPEATHLGIADWVWGTAVLLGWLSCVAIHHLTDLLAPEQTRSLHKHNSTAALAAANAASKSQTDGAAASTELGKVDIGTASREELLHQSVEQENWAAALPMLAGDAVHGVVDGVVIGFSARICGPALTWGIIGATIIHEIPVELSALAFLRLEAKFSWTKAVIWNFASAQTALIGAVIAYGMDVSGEAQGVALAFCGGIFLFIAQTELAPHMLSLPNRNLLDSVIALGLFAIGATCLGLVLLNHEHCSGGGHDHGGHDH